MQKIVADRLRPEPDRDAYGVNEARAALDRIYAWLDTQLAGREWAAGETFSLADCAAAPSLFYADWAHEIAPEHADLRAYRARLLARPSVVRAVDEARPYRTFRWARRTGIDRRRGSSDAPGDVRERSLCLCYRLLTPSSPRRVSMRKIVVGAFVSLDGVMQAPGGPREDPTQGFGFGGWVVPFFDQEFGEEVDRLFQGKPDLLLGRKTYEIFSAYWPYHDEQGPDGGIATLFNQIKKHVVSRSGDVDSSWQGSVLLRDIADVQRLRQTDGPDLVTQGSTELVHALLANDLVDRMTIFTVPVVLGSGKKLFADGSAPHTYTLAGTRVSSTGILIARYERGGEIKIGNTEHENPSSAEAARQERMKRKG
jgi:dihydrofolate reductase